MLVPVCGWPELRIMKAKWFGQSYKCPNANILLDANICVLLHPCISLKQVKFFLKKRNSHRVSHKPGLKCKCPDSGISFEEEHNTVNLWWSQAPNEQMVMILLNTGGVLPSHQRRQNVCTRASQHFLMYTPLPQICSKRIIMAREKGSMAQLAKQRLGS